MKKSVPIRVEPFASKERRGSERVRMLSGRKCEARKVKHMGEKADENVVVRLY